MSDAPRCYWMHHRLNGNLNTIPYLTKGKCAYDKTDIERLLKAYQSSNYNQCGKDSMWNGFFNAHQKKLHEVFFRKDAKEAYEILSNPQKTNLFYGFEELCEMFQEQNAINKFHIAQREQDHLLRLAEAIGVLNIENPERQDSWLQYQKISSNEVIDLIESAIETEINFPDIYPGQFCIKSKRGPITYRALQALYLAFRIKVLLKMHFNDRKISVCEIGAGLGISAYFAYIFGIKNYDIVDIPFTAITQGFYLMQCIGPKNVVLPWETRENENQIKIFHPDEYFQSNGIYNIIANVDSMSEFGETLAMQYLNKIFKTSEIFLSINSEANPIRVFELIKKLNISPKIFRYPYWMRSGYVEEIIAF